MDIVTKHQFNIIDCLTVEPDEKDAEEGKSSF